MAQSKRAAARAPQPITVEQVARLLSGASLEDLGTYWGEVLTLSAARVDAGEAVLLDATTARAVARVLGTLAARVRALG